MVVCFQVSLDCAAAPTVGLAEWCHRQDSKVHGYQSYLTELPFHTEGHLLVGIV